MYPNIFIKRSNIDKKIKSANPKRFAITASSKSATTQAM